MKGLFNNVLKIINSKKIKHIVSFIFIFFIIIMTNNNNVLAAEINVYDRHHDHPQHVKKRIEKYEKDRMLGYMKIEEGEKDIFAEKIRENVKVFEEVLGDLQLNIYLLKNPLKDVAGMYYKNGNEHVIVLSSFAKSNLYHEIGHLVDDVYLKNIHNYEKTLNKKEGFIEADGWSSKTYESFAEDFRIYAEYHLTGKSIQSLKKSKKTMYEFNEDIFDFFNEHVDLRGYSLNAILNEKTYSPWAKDYVKIYFQNGYRIDSKYLNESISREEFVNVIIPVLENNFGEIDPIEHSFIDIYNNPNIEKALSLGIIKGYNKNLFKGNEKIKREHLVSIIDRINKIYNINIDIDRSIQDRDTTREEVIVIANRIKK